MNGATINRSIEHISLQLSVFFHVISCKVFRNIFQIQWIWFYFIALYFKWIAFDTIIRRKAVSLSFYFTVFCFKLLAFYTIIMQKTVGLWFYFKVLYFEVIGFYTITIQKTIGCIVVYSKIIFFFCLGFLSRTFTNHRTAGEGKGISLSPHYHFHPLHIHLDISRVITAVSAPLNIASNRTLNGNLWFPSASC